MDRQVLPGLRNMKIKKKELEWAVNLLGLELRVSDTYPRGQVGVIYDYHKNPVSVIVGTQKRRRKV